MKKEKPASKKQAQQKAKLLCALIAIKNKKKKELNCLNDKIDALYGFRYKTLGSSCDYSYAFYAILKNSNVVIQTAYDLYALDSSAMRWSQESYRNNLPKILRYLKFDGFLIFNKKQKGWVLHPEIKKNIKLFSKQDD